MPICLKRVQDLAHFYVAQVAGRLDEHKDKIFAVESRTTTAVANVAKLEKEAESEATEKAYCDELSAKN